MKRTVLAALFVSLLPVLGPAPAEAATPTAGQPVFVPVDPVRVLSTVTGLGARSGRLEAGEVIDLQVAGTDLVPAAATAVVLNVTATGVEGTSDVRVYPTPAGPADPPVVSNLNVVTGLTVADLVQVRVGDGGSVRLRNSAGRLHLLADLAGYYVEGAPGSTYVARDPSRVLDTRTDGGRLGPGGTRTLALATEGVPADATAVVLNVTAVGADRSTDVRVYPAGAGGVPEVSNLNTTKGRIVAGLAVVKLGTATSVVLRNSAGSVDLLADLAGWFVPGDAGSAFRAVAPVRLLDTRTTLALGAGEVRDLVVAGVGAVPGQATAVALTVTGVGAQRPSDVRVFPTGQDTPEVSALNVQKAQTMPPVAAAIPNAVVVKVGRDGKVRLRNAAGSVHLLVDLAGFYLPTGDGWDVSWPQCTTAGSTTSRHPDGGAFAVVGLTRGRPFTTNECAADEWAWASTLPGEPSVYLNTDAPGPGDGPNSSRWGDPGPRPCSGAASDSGCGYDYGWNLVGYALDLMPVTPLGGKPMVWLDVEGPYANGPFWQTGYAGAVAVNRAVIDGALARLRQAGHRVGIYSDRATSTAPDWKQIVGDYRLPTVPNWVFRAPTADPVPLCTPANSFSGGPVVMVQVQPEQSGQAYDVNHLC